MRPETTIPAAPAPLDCDTAALDAVRRDLLGVLFGHTPTIVAGNLAVSLTAVVVLLGSHAPAPVGLWMAAVWLLVGLRYALVRQMRPRLASLDRAGLDRVEWRYTVIAGLTGLAWGLLPWLVYRGIDPFVDFFSVAILAGMAGGAVTATTALPGALRLYLIGTLLPFVLKGALMGGLVNLAGGLTLFFYLLVLLSFGRSAHATMRDALLLTRQNARLAEDLRQERDAVQTAMRAKNLFLAGVTHDLRQPVHAIGLHVRYLRAIAQGAAPSAATAEVCDGIDSAVRTMSQQLSRLIELSRLEAGEARVLRRALPLAELWAACAAQFAPQAADQGLALRFRPTAAVVDSDAMMLQSVLDNLVSNAVRYTGHGRVLVAARMRGSHIDIEVRDSGPGIAAEHLPLIFLPFRRFDDRSRPADQGQGLGLALARKQAELLGHTLTVRSRPGRGSVFTLRLPRAGCGQAARQGGPSSASISS